MTKIISLTRMMVHLQLLDYNVLGGKNIRGLQVVASYLDMAGDNASDEGLEKAIAIGWCFEMVSYLVKTSKYLCVCPHSRSVL